MPEFLTRKSQCVGFNHPATARQFHSEIDPLVGPDKGPVEHQRVFLRAHFWAGGCMKRKPLPEAFHKVQDAACLLEKAERALKKDGRLKDLSDAIGHINQLLFSLSWVIKEGDKK